MAETTTNAPPALSAEAVKQVSNALVEAIATNAATTTTTGTPAVTTTSGGLNGSFDLQIVYGGTTYELKVSVPTVAGGAYVFALTASTGGEVQPLAKIAFVDESNWDVTAGLPKAIAIGPVTIQSMELSIGDGTVPSS